MEIQWTLGADIAMAFDHLAPGQASPQESRDAMERTLRWLGRCRQRHDELSGAEPGRQTLWPIIQGGTDAGMRRESLDGILDRGEWTGVAIGGLSVGESKVAMHAVLEQLAPDLPRARPRYLMGVGFPDDLLEGIARGVDLFDCVAATRNGRHGSAWTSIGRVNVRGAALRLDESPLDADCDCECCSRFSRAYVRHLFVSEEHLGPRLVSIHNIRFLIRLADTARGRILDGTFDAWAASWRARYFAKGSG
jgi:queuine tRNA-ribosyltransferase